MFIPTWVAVVFLCDALSPKEGYRDQKARLRDDLKAKAEELAAKELARRSKPAPTPFSVAGYESKLGFFDFFRYERLKNQPAAKAAVEAASCHLFVSDVTIRRLSAQGRDANGVLFSARPGAALSESKKHTLPELPSFPRVAACCKLLVMFGVPALIAFLYFSN